MPVSTAMSFLVQSLEYTMWSPPRAHPKLGCEERRSLAIQCEFVRAHRTALIRLCPAAPEATTIAMVL